MNNYLRIIVFTAVFIGAVLIQWRLGVFLEQQGPAASALSFKVLDHPLVVEIAEPELNAEMDDLAKVLRELIYKLQRNYAENPAAASANLNTENAEPEAAGREQQFATAEQSALAIGKQVSLSSKGALLTRQGGQANLHPVLRGLMLDLTADLLRKQGINNFRLHWGNYYVFAGTNEGQPWEAAIPAASTENATAARFRSRRDEAMITVTQPVAEPPKQVSGRDWIVDPRSGERPDHLQSVTVWAKSAVQAEALARAAFVLGPDTGRSFLQQHPGVRALLLTPDGGFLGAAGDIVKTE